MTERRLATVRTYDDLIAALRSRVDELQITREGLDFISGLQSGYSAKLLSKNPIRCLGRVSFGAVLQSLGLAIVLVEDAEAFAQMRHRLVRRVREPQPQAKVEAKA